MWLFSRPWKASTVPTSVPDGSIELSTKACALYIATTEMSLAWTPGRVSKSKRTYIVTLIASARFTRLVPDMWVVLPAESNTRMGNRETQSERSGLSLQEAVGKPILIAPWYML